MKAIKDKSEKLFSVEEARAYSKKLIRGWHSKEIPPPDNAFKEINTRFTKGKNH